MSQNQIRTRFLAIEVEITQLPKREDLHAALAVANVKVTKLLDAIAVNCSLVIMSVSFTGLPFTEENVPDVAASLVGTIVYAGGDPNTGALCQRMRTVIESFSKAENILRFIVDPDKDTDVIIFELTLQS